MKIISRKEAKAAGLKRYFTGSPCKHGHVAERYASTLHCVAIRTRAWGAANPKERYEHLAKSNRKRRAANPSVFRTYDRKWQYNNPGKKQHHLAKRRARKLNATPPWANLKLIAAIYAAAARKTKETGIEHEVDHGIPLQGKKVCGLHVPFNLRIIAASENAAKGNRFICP